MLTQMDFVLAEQIIDGLDIPAHFGIDGDDDEFEGRDELASQIRNMGINDFALNNGVSKAVIIPDDSNFVVKIISVNI